MELIIKIYNGIKRMTWREKKQRDETILRVKGRSKDNIFSQWMERKLPQMIIEETFICTYICRAIIHIHYVNNSGYVSNKYDRN